LLYFLIRIGVLGLDDSALLQLVLQSCLRLRRPKLLGLSVLLLERFAFAKLATSNGSRSRLVSFNSAGFMIVDQVGVVHVIQVQFLAHALLMHRLYHLIVLLDSLNEALIVACCGI
jgi:hypothetical protein